MEYFATGIVPIKQDIDKAGWEGCKTTKTRVVLKHVSYASPGVCSVGTRRVGQVHTAVTMPPGLAEAVRQHHEHYRADRCTLSWNLVSDHRTLEEYYSERPAVDRSGSVRGRQGGTEGAVRAERNRNNQVSACRSVKRYACISLSAYMPVNCTAVSQRDTFPA